MVLDELIPFALEQILADDATEIVFEVRDDAVHVRGLIDGTWYPVVPATNQLLKVRGDLFTSVRRFFERQGASFTIEADPSRGGEVKYLAYSVEGDAIRVIGRPTRGEGQV